MALNDPLCLLYRIIFSNAFDFLHGDYHHAIHDLYNDYNAYNEIFLEN